MEYWAIYKNIQVSTLGNVRDLYGNERKIYHHKLTGYSVVSTKSEEGRKSELVHRLVAMLFIPNPENKICVDHINGIRTDNRVENLRWVTPKENSANKHPEVKNEIDKKRLSEVCARYSIKKKDGLIKKDSVKLSKKERLIKERQNAFIPIDGEKWIPLKGADGNYKVSNKFRVWNNKSAKLLKVYIKGNKYIIQINGVYFNLSKIVNEHFNTANKDEEIIKQEMIKRIMDESRKKLNDSKCSSSFLK